MTHPDKTLDAAREHTLRALARATDGRDLEVYQRYGRDPLQPIVGLGPANARIGLFGRDPGRDEVRHGEPFIGAGGQLIRRTLYRYLHDRPMPDFEASMAVGRAFFWANTVPYKPVGNKAWPMAVKRRFQPVMQSLLAERWQGRTLITLGREAYLWFGIAQPKAERARIEAFWKRADRFETAITITLAATDGSARQVDLHPLPHPSPLNATWYKRFPGLLENRLAQCGARLDNLLGEPAQRPAGCD